MGVTKENDTSVTITVTTARASAAVKGSGLPHHRPGNR
jgi:hypothetical protein